MIIEFFYEDALFQSSSSSFFPPLSLFSSFHSPQYQKQNKKLDKKLLRLIPCPHCIQNEKNVSSSSSSSPPSSPLLAAASLTNLLNFSSSSSSPSPVSLFYSHCFGGQHHEFELEECSIALSGIFFEKKIQILSNFY